MPSSCGQCKPADLDPENQEIWQLACRFPGLKTTDGMTGRMAVDYQAARYVAEKEYLDDEMFWLESLEAIVKGLNDGK